MSRIPKVASYRVRVIDSTGREVERLTVQAPTKYLAELAVRFDYPRMWGKRLSIYRERAKRRS